MPPPSACHFTPSDVVSDEDKTLNSKPLTIKRVFAKQVQLCWTYFEEKHMANGVSKERLKIAIFRVFEPAGIKLFIPLAIATTRKSELII